MTPKIWTLGHSNLEWAQFLELLTQNKVQLLVDVRRFPGSRKYPHFNKDAMIKSLEDAGIEYIHMEALGGRRSPLKNSINTAWKNKAFQGYADYMNTMEFQNAAENVMKMTDMKRTAIMCSEAVWWSCHRSLIADYFKWKGVEVLHIVGKKVTPHPYTSPARIRNGVLEYSPDQLTL